MPPKERSHLLFLPQAEQGKAMAEGMKNNFRVLINGGVDNALVEKEVFLGQEVEGGDFKAFKI